MPEVVSNEGGMDVLAKPIITKMMNTQETNYFVIDFPLVLCI